MDNKVIGNKKGDNKQAGNKAKAQSATEVSKRVGDGGKFISYGPQNSRNQTPAGPGQSGDKGVQLQAKRQKTIIRKGASYTDQAISQAKRQRGMA